MLPFGAKTYSEGLELIKSNTFELGFFDLNLDGELKCLDLLKRGTSAGLYPVVVSGESESETLEKAFSNES